MIYWSLKLKDLPVSHFKKCFLKIMGRQKGTREWGVKMSFYRGHP